MGSIQKAFRSTCFTFGSMCSIAAVSGTQQNLKLFLSLDRHFSQGDAARVLSLVLSFSIVGRLLMGWLADSLFEKICNATDLLASRSRHPVSVPVPFASSPLCGGGSVWGSDSVRLHDHSLMTAEIFGMQVLGRLLGVILTAGGIAEAVSPWLTGRLRDATGNYSEGCFVLVGIALLGATVVAGLPQRRKTGMSQKAILRLGTVKNVASFKEHLHSLGLTIPCDDETLERSCVPLAPNLSLAVILSR